MQKTIIKSGSILMAEPFMDSIHFKDAVILIVDHSEKEGTVGFIINKTLKLNMSEVVRNFPKLDLDLHYGGPVQTDTLHYVHTYGDILKDSIPVQDKLFWGGDFKQLKALIKEKVIDESGIRFYLGYSGWSSGQLEDEFIEGTWMNSKMDLNYLFKTDLTEVWPQAVSDLGKEYEIIAEMPKYINFN